MNNDLQKFIDGDIEKVFILNNEDVQTYDIFEPNQMWVEVLDRSKLDFKTVKYVRYEDNVKVSENISVQAKLKTDSNYFTLGTISESTSIWINEGKMLNWINTNFKLVHQTKYHSYWIDIDTMTHNIDIPIPQKNTIPHYNLFKKLEATLDGVQTCKNCSYYDNILPYCHRTHVKLTPQHSCDEWCNKDSKGQLKMKV